MYNELQIFFFSGTGNARNVAQWIKEKAIVKSFKVTTNDLSKINRKKIARPKANSLIGFISPTHGFNFPPVMMYFIFRFPKANTGNKVFLINTRAGMKLGKIYIPGLSGITLWLSAIVLLLKGYKIAGMRPIDLPSNWISLHPSLRGNAVVTIYERCNRITGKFAEDILSGKKNFRGAFDLIQDLLIAPISIGYFFIGRFLFAKSFYANSLCDNCNTCIRNCPVGAIKIVNDRPYWTFNCESCMKCMNECPQRAIQTGHGYIVLLFFINSWILVFVWGGLTNLIGFKDQSLLFSILQFIINNGMPLVLIFLLYRLIHSLKRVTVFKQIIEYTSFTKYNFWGRYNIRKMFASARIKNQHSITKGIDYEK